MYIARRQNTVAQYIVTLPIMTLCIAAKRNMLLKLSSQLWEHPPLDILVIRAVHAAAEVEGEMGVEELEGEGER